MIPKYSVKTSVHSVSGCCTGDRFRSCFADEDDNRSAAGNESAVCDRCHDGCRGKSGGSGKKM